MNIGLILNIVLALCLLGGGTWYFTRPATAEQVATPIAVSAPKEQPKYTKLDGATIENLVNTKRSENGLGTLAVSETLRQSACLKLEHMRLNNYWAHNAPDGTTPWHFFDLAGYTGSLKGENLAYDFRSEQDTVTAWMDSQGHKDVIFGDYNEHGVCTYVGPYQGKDTHLVVHHFGLNY